MWPEQTPGRPAPERVYASGQIWPVGHTRPLAAPPDPRLGQRIPVVAAGPPRRGRSSSRPAPRQRGSRAQPTAGRPAPKSPKLPCRGCGWRRSLGQPRALRFASRETARWWSAREGDRGVVQVTSGAEVGPERIEMTPRHDRAEPGVERIPESGLAGEVMILIESLAVEVLDDQRRPRGKERVEVAEGGRDRCRRPLPLAV